MINEKVNKIREMLNNGERVALKCIDEESFAPTPNSYNEEILKLDEIVVSGLTKNGHFKISGGFMIRVTELMFFEIVSEEPSFDDLIDVAVRAYKDGVLSNVDLRDNEVFLTGLGIIDKSRAYVFQSAINDIKALYTETFVIECEGDCRRIKQNAKITFANGNSVVMDQPPTADGIVRIWNDGRYDFTVLQGATVTQRRSNG